MLLLHIVTSLMLATFIPSKCLAAPTTLSSQSFERGIPIIAARFESPIPTTTTISPCGDQPCSTNIPSSRLPCDKANGTAITSRYSTWTVLCDTDFIAQDIYPFLLAETFEECLRLCDDYNNLHGGHLCAGFVFAPDRIRLENSCYLKSSLNNLVTPTTVHLIAATIHPSTTLSISTILYPIPNLVPVSTGEVQPEQTIAKPPKAVVAQNDTKSTAKRGRRPTVTSSTFLGTSVNEVASKYVSHAPAKPEPLSADMLETGVNLDLIAKYPLASDTGSWTSGDAAEYRISDMKVVPRLSRDGGRGGNINGTNIFIFCDTSTYGKDRDPLLGYLNGFVSSSVAVDEKMNGLHGSQLSLVNSLGQWQDDVGRMRGWIPMTTGEEAFNIAVSGNGYRYAVWPNASPVALNATHSIMHAPLVYLEVDMQDQSSPSFTSLGNTLVLISIDPVYGPHADRVHNQFFLQREVNWGSLGGIRSWGSGGQDNLDGHIYVLGQADHGLLIGKVAARDFDDRNSYTYWDGHTWTKDMPPASSSSDAFILDESIMSIDIFYSPAHGTFVMIYLTAEADNNFYYRYLVGKNNETLLVLPPYEDGGNEEYVEEILTNAWSARKVLFTVPTPNRGYAYAGGIHAGYFGADDITNGGTKVLCTWTEHTKVDPEKPDSGYAHKSQVIDLGFDE